MCKCNPSIKTPYCGGIDCKWPEITATIPDSSRQMEHLFDEWQGLGTVVSDLGNIVQNDRPVPFPSSDVDEFKSLVGIVKSKLDILTEDTLNFIQRDKVYKPMGVLSDSQYDKIVAKTINSINIRIIPTEKVLNLGKKCLNNITDATICYASNFLTEELVREKLIECFLLYARPLAGETRGKLSVDAYQIEYKCSNSQLDEIYELGVNPINIINRLPVIWGDKIIIPRGSQNDRAHIYIHYKILKSLLIELTKKTNTFNEYIIHRRDLFNVLIGREVIYKFDEASDLIVVSPTSPSVMPPDTSAFRDKHEYSCIGQRLDDAENWENWKRYLIRSDGSIL